MKELKKREIVYLNERRHNDVYAFSVYENRTPFYKDCNTRSVQIISQ